MRLLSLASVLNFNPHFTFAVNFEAGAINNGGNKTNAVPDDTGTILVTVSQTEEIEADHADLFVTIRGASLFAGKAALTKAREVSQLVAAL